MIRIRIDRSTLSIRVRGHAGYGPKGSDIVCAGVSALVQTWARCVLRFRDSGWLEGCAVQVTPGHAEVSAFPKPQTRDMVEVAFLTVCEGLEMLHRAGREYICVDAAD